MVYKQAVVAAFCIYAQRGEVAANREGWSLCIKLSWKLPCGSWKNHGIAFLNFFGNTVGYRRGNWERSGSVVECLTRDRRVAGSSLTGVTALWSLSKTHLS